MFPRALDCLQAANSFGAFGLSKSPLRLALSPWLFLLPDQLIELGLVFGLPSGARFIMHNPRGFGLSHALARIGLHRFRSGKCTRLAFSHLKEEYGVVWARAEAQ